MVLTSLAVLCVLVSMSGLSLGQVVQSGACPTPPTEPNFDVSRYMGTWYEQVKFFAVFEAFQNCVKAEYALNEDNTVTVTNSGIFGRLFPVRISGRATVPDPAEPAKLSVSFFGSSSDQPNYQVVETDYVNYSVVFSCQSVFGNSNAQIVWVLVRNRSGLSEGELQSIYGRLQSYGIDTTKFTTTDQTNCRN